MIFLLHLAVTWSFVGLIWVIQVVVYPQLRRVGTADFTGYHFAHCLRIGLLVTPLILLEAGTAAWLWWSGQRDPIFVSSLVLILVAWLATALLLAPAHLRLMTGRDEITLNRVLGCNWIRTAAWSLRGGLVTIAFARSVGLLGA